MGDTRDLWHLLEACSVSRYYILIKNFCFIMHWNLFKFHCSSDVQEKHFKDCLDAKNLSFLQLQNSTMHRVKLWLGFDIANLWQKIINQQLIKIMKTTILIFMISILTITGCRSQQKVKFTDNKSVLNFYKQYSSFTDPVVCHFDLINE